MFNSNNGYSLADLAAVANGNDGNSFGSQNGAWWIIILFLFIFSGFRGNGLMGGMGINNPAVQGAITRADLFEGFNGQDVNAQLRNTINGISQGFYAQNSAIMGGFSGIDKSLCLGFNSVNDGLTQNRFDAQKCCCETNRNIDAIRFENSKNTTDIVNAIREDGNATRALINANEMQNLRDKVADKDRDLMAANFQISQQRQNDYLVNQIKPCAVPAYLTCSPYESAMVASRYYGCNGAY